MAYCDFCGAQLDANQTACSLCRFDAGNAEKRPQAPPICAPGTGESPQSSEGCPAKRCPFCAEEIKAAAVLCRFCGMGQRPIVAAAQQPKNEESLPTPTRIARCCPDCALPMNAIETVCSQCGFNFNNPNAPPKLQPGEEPQVMASATASPTGMQFTRGKLIIGIAVLLVFLIASMADVIHRMNAPAKPMSAQDTKYLRQYHQDQAYKEAYAAREAAERGDFAAMREHQKWARANVQNYEDYGGR